MVYNSLFESQELSLPGYIYVNSPDRKSENHLLKIREEAQVQEKKNK